MGSGSERSSSASGKRAGSSPNPAAKFRKLAATSRPHTPTHLTSPMASSSGTYVDAICAVLNEHPGGLEKEQIIRAIEEKSHVLFPGRPFETVKAGLQNAFSQHPKTREPRMFPYGLEDGTGSRISGKTVWALAGTDLTGIVADTGDHTSQSQQQPESQDYARVEESGSASQFRENHAAGQKQIPLGIKSGVMQQRPSSRSPSTGQASNLALWRSSGPDEPRNTSLPSPREHPTPAALSGSHDPAMNGADEDEQELLKLGRLVKKRKHLRRRLDDMTENAESAQSRVGELEREREKRVLRAQALEHEARQAREAAEEVDLDLKRFQEQTVTRSKEAATIEAQIGAIDIELQG